MRGGEQQGGGKGDHAVRGYTCCTASCVIVAGMIMGRGEGGPGVGSYTGMKLLRRDDGLCREM